MTNPCFQKSMSDEAWAKVQATLDKGRSRPHQPVTPAEVYPFKPKQWIRADERLWEHQHRKTGADLREARSGRAGALADANDAEPFNARDVDSLSTPATLIRQRCDVETAHAHATELPEYEPEVNPWAEPDMEGWVPDGEVKETADPNELQPPAPRPPDPPAGWCRFCDVSLVGLKADAKFCDDAHRKAYARKMADFDAAEREFKDYKLSEYAKARAAFFERFHHVARAEMLWSLKRAGITADVFTTAAGIMVLHDGPLPPMTCEVLLHTEGDKWRACLVGVPIKFSMTANNHTSGHPDVVGLIGQVDGPERSASLYDFDIPPQGEYLGKGRLQIRFTGDPAPRWDDGWDEAPPTPEETATVARLLAWDKKHERPSMYARPTYGPKADNSYLPTRLPVSGIRPKKAA